MPLNCHFMAVDVRERGAEMAQLGQNYGSNPPPCNLCLPPLLLLQKLEVSSIKLQVMYDAIRFL